MRILILDDDPVIVDLFYNLLSERHGSLVEIYATTSVEKALGVVDSYNIHLAYLDSKMPMMDGYGFMRLANGKLGGVKFITGLKSELDTRMSDEEKKTIMSLEKPIKSSELINEVDELLTDWMLHEMIKSLKETRDYSGNLS